MPEKAYLSPENAQRVIDSFRIAREGQSEFMLEGKRYLATQRDQDYQEYAEVMERAKLPHLEDSKLSSDEYVVGEIPVGGLTLSQFVRSYQDPFRANSTMAVHLVGSALKKLLATPPFLLPDADDFSINRCLIDYHKGYVLLPPPMRFVPATQYAAAAIEVVAEEQLEPFVKFGGATLLKAFGAGMRDA